MSDKKKVVIVDDHPLFRQCLAQLIRREADIEIVGEAENATDAIELIRNTLPNLAIVDIRLKASSGLELIKSIKAWSINVHILVLSVHEESLYAERACRRHRVYHKESADRRNIVGSQAGARWGALPF